MATQNLFEQYGIKEVADVTFYRIEKKEETFESQREISVASILKGGIELRTVYPLIAGLGAEEGFEAYVFTNANILTGTNYDCDDTNTIIANLRTEYTTAQAADDSDIETAVETKALDLVKSAVGIDGASLGDFTAPTVLSFVDQSSNVELSASKVSAFDSVSLTQDAGIETNIVGRRVTYKTVTRTVTVTNSTDVVNVVVGSNATIEVTSEDTDLVTITEDAGNYIVAAKSDVTGTAKITVAISNDEAGVDEAPAVEKTFSVAVAAGAASITGSPLTLTAKIKVPASYTYTVTTSIVFDGTNTADASTGVYNTSSKTPDADYEDGIGTHEYSYPQQICMLFAKKQNLITKTGVRYQFQSTDSIFGDITFNDEFAGAPNSDEKLVVVGLAGKFTEGTYDVEEINEYIKNIGTTFSAKAYDVVYDDYAELVVEDEMGFFRNDFLGYAYNRDGGSGNATVDFFDDNFTYTDWVTDNGTLRDAAIANAVMWEDGVHYSINDAIDALRQKQLILDASEKSGKSGLKGVFGGYKVSSKETTADVIVTPDASTEDIYADGYSENTYAYSYTGMEGEAPTSEYPLVNVEAAVEEIALSAGAFGKAIRIDAGPVSNRAIYIAVNNANSAAGAYIYLLHNKNYRRLATDKDGIFSFEDKKGNTLYYQDKIFKGIEYLALVILGNKGLIFVVNRHGNTDVSRVAWMVNESGYVNDKVAASLVRNGLIHTTDITVKDETFEATCTVKSLKVRRIVKKTNHYIPVLYLDTLKISTIEQTAEEVYAQGGKGNAKLIGWDYGKEITLNLQDALFTPASMSAIFGSYEGNDFTKGVKDVTSIDRMEPCTAKRSFIVPAGNSNGTPTEADKTAQAVYYDPNTMKPYPDGTPIAEGERFLKYTRSVAYAGQSLGHMIEISADKFPGTYKIVGDTFARAKDGGVDQRFQFVIPQAKMQSNQTITLEAEGDPTVFDMNMTVLRPDDGVMVRFIQYDVVENEEENDGSTMVKDTENLNLLDDAELFKVTSVGEDDEEAIGATEY